ncbi:MULTISPECIES: hypothetical protein [unclassified Nostoc]|uniref:hypothetical protein n=1 Tax=unclassified Nostoc TaxID=2593658 RepID=UPI0013D06854|nr:MULTISPECIES: hypothetical protein [unclassified Nostoc]MBE8998128.1 hypothetical protein [Nostoc sp. LEGE 12447]NEU82162.1 hypothetical protein [Nostoc sp. UIC 10630]
MVVLNSLLLSNGIDIAEYGVWSLSPDSLMQDNLQVFLEQERLTLKYLGAIAL